MAARAVVGEQFSSVLEAARAGADWAWKILYDSLAPTVVGYLRARGAPDPDGVAGEVFCQLVRDIHRFEGTEEGFRSWVFVMAHHRLLDDLRKRKRRPEFSTEPAEFSSIGEARDLETEVVDRRRADEIREIIEELTTAQRDVLLLRIYGEMSIEEVAAAMGKRAGAIKALQRRGLEAVRRRLDQDVSE
jgi:RNA polymerase sigma factor (sigma-70 family)